MAIETKYRSFNVLRARLDGLRDGLLVFFVGVVLLRVAAAVYFLTHLLVAAAPVVMLASRVTVANFTSNATRRVVGQWGGAGGAICEDHFGVARGGMRVAFDGEAFCLVLLVSYMPLVIALKLWQAPGCPQVVHTSTQQRKESKRVAPQQRCSRAART